LPVLGVNLCVLPLHPVPLYMHTNQLGPEAVTLIRRGEGILSKQAAMRTPEIRLEDSSASHLEIQAEGA
jgi:hypothetical protein